MRWVVMLALVIASCGADDVARPAPGSAPAAPASFLSTGPFALCSCDDESDAAPRCRLEWSEPVSCRRDAECSLQTTPRPHTIRHPHPRRRGGNEGCPGGSFTTRCHEGTCVLEPNLFGC